MRIWRPDAGDLNPNDIPDVYIYKNNTIEDYLSASSHEKRLFLIGSKGSGKTLLLRYKAYLYHEKENRLVNSMARNQMVENLDFNFVTLSEKDLEQLADYNTWVNIWDFTIALLILRRTQVGLPADQDDLNQIFPEYFNLNSVVSKIMNDTPKFISSRFFNRNVDLKARLSLVSTSFSLFIDRLDQALDQIISNDMYKYLEDDQGRNVAFRVWQSAQFGLLVSCYNFHTAVNSHLKIFATARLEALGVESQLRPNIESYCTRLAYTKAELKEIFLNNIRQTPTRYLEKKSTDSLLQGFFGFLRMPHPIAKKQDETPHVEEVFDFLCRHTFERPREIIMLGQSLFEVIAKPEYRDLDRPHKIERIRRVTNDTAHEQILRGYLSEIVPGFKREHLQKCCEVFSQNIASRHQVEKLKNTEILNYLYRIGLIGFDFNGRQSFLPAAQYIHDEYQQIQEADYYFLHPTLDKQLQTSISFQAFYNRYNIIGKDYPFTPPPPYMVNGLSHRPLSDFIPRDIPGRCTPEINWEHTGIKVPLGEIYEAYFLHLDDHDLIKFRQEKLEKGFRILSCITSLYFARVLSKKYKKDLSAWEMDLLNKFEALKEPQEYTAGITDLSAESLKKFGHRLCGRLITLGLLLCVRLEYADIHAIVNHYDFNPDSKKKIKEESALPFIRKAFFINGLKETAPENDTERSLIQESMSLFEREKLRTWEIYYKQHELLSSPYLDDDEKKDLESLIK